MGDSVSKVSVTEVLIPGDGPKVLEGVLEDVRAAIRKLRAESGETGFQVLMGPVEPVLNALGTAIRERDAARRERDEARAEVARRNDHSEKYHQHDPVFCETCSRTAESYSVNAIFNERERACRIVEKYLPLRMAEQILELQAQIRGDL